MADIDFGDWRDYAGLAAQMAPALLNRGARNPYESPEMQRTLQMQQQRMEATQPAFETAARMAHSMSPIASRGAAPTFNPRVTGSASSSQSMLAPRTASTPQQSRGDIRSSRADFIAPNGQTSGAGNKGAMAAGLAAKAVPFLSKLFNGGAPKEGVSAQMPPMQSPSFEGETQSYAQWVDQALKDTHRSRPNVETSASFTIPDGPTLHFVDGSDEYPIYTDGQGNYYDQQGQFLGNIAEFMGGV